MANTIIENLPLLTFTNVYDPLVVSSNLATGSAFRFVLDVSGALGSARLKCDPHPVSRFGFFGINRIVETLFLPTIPQISSAWQAGNWATQANLTLREEISGTLATGVITSKVFAAGGHAGYIDYLNAVQENYRLISTGTTGAAGDILFSNRPTERSLLFTTPEFVHAIVDPALVSGVQCRVRYYNSVGTLVRTFFTSRAGTGVSNIINMGGQAVYNLTGAQCSDGNAGSLNFPPQGGFYDYSLVADNANTTTGKRRSLDYRIYLKTIQSGINVQNVCSGTIYEHNSGHEMVLFFLNEYGSWDTFEFTMKRRRRVNVTRQQYGRNFDTYGFENWIQNINTEYQYEYELNTDWLTNTEFTWLLELIVSRFVYMHMPTIGLMPVLLQNNDYRIERRINDGLRQLQIIALAAEKIIA